MIVLPDIEEGKLIAARLLGVDREDVTDLLRLERLHGALVLPGLRVEAVAAFKSPGAVLGRLMVECAISGIVPRLPVAFGWLMLQRAVDLSDVEWVWTRGEKPRLPRAFARHLRQGEDPGRALSAWIDAHVQPALSVRTRPGRAIAVSRPITNLPASVRTPVGEWACAVDDAVDEYLRRSDLPSEHAITLRPQVCAETPESELELYASTQRRVPSSGRAGGHSRAELRGRPGDRRGGEHADARRAAASRRLCAERGPARAVG